MIGVVVVSHGQLAEEFISAAEHVLGPQRQMRAVAIGPDDDMEVKRSQILGAVRAVDDGSGVIILTDMFGGTPSNLAISVIYEGRIEVIAGVNLPMLVKLGEIRERAQLEEAASKAQQAGRHYIRIASAELAGALWVPVRRLEIVNQRGLHARASRKLAELAIVYDAAIIVRRDDEAADATSLMDLMMLGAGLGSEIEVEADGPQAEEALEAITALVASKFGEDEWERRACDLSTADWGKS